MNHATAKLIATFFYSGLMKPAPGTWGSLAALPAAWLLHLIGGPLALTIATIVAYMAGLYATRTYTAGSDNHDPGEVVIDEVVGMWIALLPVSFGARMMGVDILALYPGWIVAFLAFRLFDITKPGPIGAADKRGDAEGVMLDDVYAGFAAAFTVIVLAYAAHGLMGT
jgi:phosphatidylglycerophosphatase A